MRAQKQLVRQKCRRTVKICKFIGVGPKIRKKCEKKPNSTYYLIYLYTENFTQFFSKNLKFLKLLHFLKTLVYR